MGKCSMRLLADKDVKQIKERAVRILEEVGVVVSHGEAKKMLEESGARVDHQTGLVRVPDNLTEECLRRLPQKVTLGGRSADNDIVLEPNNEETYGRSISGSEWYVDPADGKRRKVIRSDVGDFARIADALENIHIASGPYYTEANLNLKARDVCCLEILLENTSKPVLIQPYGGENTEYMIKLGVVERGSVEELRKRPRFIVMMSPVSPLSYQKGDIDIMIAAGKYGIPVENNSMIICGASGPVTLAGWLQLTIAEHMAGVVISQVVNPGAPIICAPRPVVLEMTTGLPLQGTVENAMMSAALAQVAKEGFKWVTDLSGPASESHLRDGQSIIERCFNTTLTAYSGADILGAAGNYESSLIMDPIQLAIDDEILGMTARAVRGITVNDDTLGLDVIRRVGAGTGKTYLDDEHTLKYFRTEYFKPKTFTRSSRATWESEGAKDLSQRAKERVNGILKEQKPAPLSGAMVKEMRLISESAERELTTQ
jgi:trimethylamine--corrinoid protein Co-methyltransferase